MERARVHVLVDTLLDVGQSLIERASTPPEARQHFRNARMEALLGVRALVDAALARNEAQGPAADRPTGSVAIPVE